MRISIEIDGTTFTVQPDARAVGQSTTANMAGAMMAGTSPGAEASMNDISAGVSKAGSADNRADAASRDDLFARAAALGALDGGPAPSSIEQGLQPSPERWVGASLVESGDKGISAGPAPTTV